MTLPDDVRTIVETSLDVDIRDSTGIGGGCTAHAIRLHTDRGQFFLKWSRDEAARTFAPEAAGLDALHESAVELVIPEPLLIHEPAANAPGVLVTEWIEPGAKGGRFWEDFGRALADMHRQTADRFGFETDNYIGRLPQQNEWIDSWTEFFASRRIEPQVRMARDNGRWRDDWSPHLDRLLSRLKELLPVDPPASILHGDLWSGNFFATGDGRAAIFDPAAYFGHREADLAMTELFGGFDRRFYGAYREAWPLADDYPIRREIYNLYHLINHLNHFGSGYAGSVQDILARY